MPDGAECRTALNAERRQMPDYARCRTAPNGGCAVRRRLAFSAVRHSAPYGTLRRLAFCAVWHFAPLSSAPFGFRALWQLSSDLVPDPLILRLVQQESADDESHERHADRKPQSGE